MLDLCKSPLPPGFELRVSHVQDRRTNHYITAAYTSRQFEISECDGEEMSKV